MPIYTIQLMIVLLGLVGITGCGGANDSPDPNLHISSDSGANPDLSTDPPSGLQAVFTMIGPDGMKHHFDLKRLESLPLVSFLSEGNPQEGPSLKSILNSAGLSEFQELKITGREGTRSISKTQVTDSLILDFDNRGGVKLVSPEMRHDDRLRDVNRIEVQ